MNKWLFALQKIIQIMEAFNFYKINFSLKKLFKLEELERKLFRLLKENRMPIFISKEALRNGIFVDLKHF